MLSQMIKTNAKTGEKNYSFWVDDVTNFVTTRSYKVSNLFLKLNTKESYEYPNLIYSIRLMVMEKKEFRKKLFLILNWGITKFPLFLVW